MGSLISKAVETLAARLPPGWRVKGPRGVPRGASGAGGVVTLTAPDGTAADCLLAGQGGVEPRDVTEVVARLRSRQGAIPLVVASFLGPGVRDRLTAAGVGYLDLTGNVRLVAERPGLFIVDRGADRNPSRQERSGRSLRGPKAGRIVRALCDSFPPLGTRDLAKRTRTDPGYVSRVLDLLDREDLIRREPRGPVIDCDWRGLLRRWAGDYSPLAAGRARSYLAPRGLSAVLERLRQTGATYAVTGSAAAAEVAPVAAPRLLACYVDDAESVAASLDLRPTESGANVLLLLPFDPVVYERTWERNGVTFAAISQVVADLLTGPGRGPAEAEALMTWMGEHERDWRS